MLAQEQSRSGQLTENKFVVGKLDEMADVLEQQNASIFRVRAYRDAASYIAALTRPIMTIYHNGGLQGLEDLPTIGTAIATAIAELLDNGKFSALDRLRGSANPEKLLQTVPMIGPALARLISETLHIETLEALEAAALDGRLSTVKGMGKRRIDSIRHSLNDMLARRRPSRKQVANALPPISDILAVDQEYRETTDTLPSIRPRRFNKAGDARIPILHTDRGPWRFTVLFSNTASAHKYGRTRDWVVMFCDSDDHPETQLTVVTQHGGPLDGRRVIRGHEEACRRYYGV